MVADIVTAQASKWLHVNREELLRELSAARATLQEDKPKLLVLVGEQKTGMTAPYAWWLPPSPTPAALETFNNALARRLQRRDWEQVEQSAISTLKPEHHSSAILSDADALDLCGQVKARLVLVGTVTATSPGPSEMSAGMSPANAHLAAHLLSCRSKTTVARIDEDYGDVTTMDMSVSGAEEKALKIAGREAERLIEVQALQALSARH